MLHEPQITLLHMHVKVLRHSEQEKAHMVSLVLEASETFGDATDVQRLARQLLNKTIWRKNDFLTGSYGPCRTS